MVRKGAAGAAGAALRGALLVDYTHQLLNVTARSTQEATAVYTHERHTKPATVWLLCGKRNNPLLHHGWLVVLGFLVGCSPIVFCPVQGAVMMVCCINVVVNGHPVPSAAA